jgi:hypothetical protein
MNHAIKWISGARRAQSGMESFPAQTRYGLTAGRCRRTQPPAAGSPVASGPALVRRSRSEGADWLALMTSMMSTFTYQDIVAPGH